MTPVQHEAEIRSLRRDLLFYRSALAVLLLGTIAVVWRNYRNVHAVSEFGEFDETWTVDLPERLEEAERAYGFAADFSETYFWSEEATVHMHFMGHAQSCPMHLHPASSEATVVAGGSARVVQVWGEEGAFRTSEVTLPTGSLYASPPYTAHEVVNPDAEGMLANLVFTMPRFSGNFYVRPDDPRILMGAAPTRSRVADELPGFVASGQPWSRVPTAALDGRVSEVLVGTSWTLPANAGKPLIAYVAAGAGDADGHALRPGILAHLVSSSPITIAAEPGSPLAMILFDPRGALDAHP